MVAYNNKKYYIDIVETKPASAISIIETDCEVDFAPPLDYKEPEQLQQPLIPLGKSPVQGSHFWVTLLIASFISFISFHYPFGFQIYVTENEVAYPCKI